MPDSNMGTNVRLRILSTCLAVALALGPGCLADGMPAGEKAKPILSRIPEIFSLSPAGARPGTKLRVEVLGENLDGAEELTIAAEGIEGRIVESSYLRAAADITIGPETPPGVYGVRVTSPLGVSNLFGFRVSVLPHDQEAEENGTREQAQEVKWPGVINAVLFPDEDVDFYRFRGRRGHRLALEVLAARNGSGLNAEMYLLDATGARVAVADDEKGSDPLIEFTPERDGDYYAVVRGVFSVLNISFPTGHPAYTYQFRISSPPILGGISPAWVAAGEKTEVLITGSGLDGVERLAASSTEVVARIVERKAESLRAVLEAGGDASGSVELTAISSGGESSPLRVRVGKGSASGGPREPGGTTEKRLAVPGSVTGVLGSAGQIDRIPVVIPDRGRYVFEVEAGRLNSLLDSVLSLHDAAGKKLAQNDDGAFGENAQGDSKLEYSFAAAGEYYLEIRQAVLDLHGPQYGYRVIARPARPHFVLTPAAGGDKYPWVRTMDRIAAYPGAEITIPVNVEWLEGLENLGADVQLSMEGLPAGVEARPGWAYVKDGKYDKASRFTARAEITVRLPAEAPSGSHRIRIRGKATVGDHVIEGEETIRVSAAGRYVMASTGGFPYSSRERYLSVVRAPVFLLRPEIGDERYPVRFTMQPGTIKTLTLTVLPPGRFPQDIRFVAENLPSGLRIHHVEARPGEQQYLLHLKADRECERGWFPLVTFVARDSSGVVVPTPYFGMAVR